MKQSKKLFAALAVASTLAGSALVALPTQAHAADVWDRLAACESGGNWSINTGNGYYGGLQFAGSTWTGYGGTAYAPRADLASKAQQIAIARKVLADAGPGAWPTCSIRAGLTRANGAAGASAPAPASQQQTQKKAAPQREQAAAQEATRQAAAQEDRAQEATAQRASAEQAAAQQVAVERAQAESRVAPVERVVPALQPLTEVPAVKGYVVVRSGQTIGDIAKAVGSDWRTVWSMNVDEIPNPDHVVTGQLVGVPKGGVPATLIEALESIAELNGLINPGA